ncbi:MAG TPA: hypothetical protein VK974_03700 [Methylophilaceae bacterium]|nr:hypothetical protein [Methylophilaceae bacterium]
MQIFDSAWLIKMLKKSGKSPQDRLLGIFDVLADWADAPHTRGALTDEQATASTPDHLLDYLCEEALACGAQMPEALAQQIYFIALSALQESLRSPDHNHFTHAKVAAKALIAAQTEKPAVMTRPVIYGMAATLLVAIIASGLFLYNDNQRQASTMISAAIASINSPEQIEEDVAASPKQAAEMYALAEKMRHGDCRYVEALQIPDADKKVYIENVIGGKIPTNQKDMALAQSYMQKINCSYTPMLMKNSVN